ncbi:MAG TPA: hypothetical protein VF681_04760 [Abditibacteriaceae bacterium]
MKNSENNQPAGTVHHKYGEWSLARQIFDVIPHFCELKFSDCENLAEASAKDISSIYHQVVYLQGELDGGISRYDNPNFDGHLLYQLQRLLTGLTEVGAAEVLEFIFKPSTRKNSTGYHLKYSIKFHPEKILEYVQRHEPPEFAKLRAMAS